MTARWVVHNLIAHPLLVLWPRLGEWLHDATAPEPEPGPWVDHDGLKIHLDSFATFQAERTVDMGNVYGWDVVGYTVKAERLPLATFELPLPDETRWAYPRYDDPPTPGELEARAKAEALVARLTGTTP